MTWTKIDKIYKMAFRISLIKNYYNQIANAMAIKKGIRKCIRIALNSSILPRGNVAINRLTLSDHMKN